MTWDQRAKRGARSRTFDTPTKEAAVAARVDAIKASHAKHPDWGWQTVTPGPVPLTDADWDALQVTPITGDVCNRTQVTPDAVEVTHG